MRASVAGIVIGLLLAAVLTPRIAADRRSTLSRGCARSAVVRCGEIAAARVRVAGGVPAGDEGDEGGTHLARNRAA